METRRDASKQPATLPEGFGWGARIRTWEWRNQNTRLQHETQHYQLVSRAPVAQTAYQYRTLRDRLPQNSRA